MAVIAVLSLRRALGLHSQVRRLQLPAEVRLGHHRDRRAHAGLVERWNMRA
jgi:hypothetical protein